MTGISSAVGTWGKLPAEFGKDTVLLREHVHDDTARLALGLFRTSRGASDHLVDFHPGLSTTPASAEAPWLGDNAYMSLPHAQSMEDAFAAAHRILDDPQATYLPNSLVPVHTASHGFGLIATDERVPRPGPFTTGGGFNGYESHNLTTTFVGHDPAVGGVVVRDIAASGDAPWVPGPAREFRFQ
jgi:hypothetical protein